MEKIKCFFKKIQDNKTKQVIVICFCSMFIILFLLPFFNNGFSLGKAETIICIVVNVVLLLLYALFVLSKMNFHKFVFISIIMIGGLSLMIQPILNIPDEQAHFARAEIVSRGKFFVDRDEQTFEAIQSTIDMQNEIRKPITQSFLKDEKIDYTRKETYHIAATNLTFLYIPQAAGMLVAKILDLNVIWLLWLGRFFNLLLYAVLVSLAIKLAPKLRCALYFMATLPMAIQQAASLSPDATINGVVILFIGYFLKLYCDSEEINWKELLIFLCIGIVVTLAKVTNICIFGLVLLLPLKKHYGIRKTILIKSLLIGIVVLIGGGYYVYTTTFAPNLGFESYFQENNVNSSEQIKYILSDTLRWLRHFGMSAINRSEEYITMLNRFGWLEYGNPALTIVTIFMFGKISFQEDGVLGKKIHKCIVLLIILATYGITCLALYISWTPVGGADTLGVQGRYLIPALTLIPLLFSTKNKEDIQISYEQKVVNITVIFIMAGAMLTLTATQYY